MSSQQALSAAFILSLLGGIFIGLGGVMGMLFFGFPAGWFRMMGGMMGGFGMMMGAAFGVFGIASGVIVILGAVMLRASPKDSSTWGVIILIFSLLSLPSGGGFFIGAILGLVGGILALTWRPS